MKRYARLTLTLLAVPLLAFGPAERAAEAQWALVVGVGEYPALGEAAQLPGAVFDALAMRDVLVGRWGFAPDHVRLLLNADATRAGIRTGVTEWLASVAGPEDRVVVYFAGHGSQARAEVGPGGAPELRRTFAPHDVRLDDAGFDIAEEEMHDWLRALPTRNVLFVFDGSHVAGLTPRDATPFARTRSLPRDPDALPSITDFEARGPAAGPGSARGVPPEEAWIVEISATQPDQVAVEMLFPGDGGGDPYFGGAFTTQLVQRLWRAPASATPRDVFAEVRDALRRSRFEQSPHLAPGGAAEPAPLFAAAKDGADPGPPLFPVWRAEDGRVELGAGQSLGVSTGSLFEVEGGALVLVDEVARDRSWGTMVDGEGAAPAADAKARLHAHRFPDAPLLVNVAAVDSMTRELVAQAFADRENPALVDDAGHFSHLLLRQTANEVRVVASDGAVRHTFPASPSGRRLLLAALEQEAAVKRLADMENFAQPFPMQVSLADGRTSFAPGQTLTFHATAERDGYLTLVDLGTDGTVTVLFPNPYTPDNLVRAGQRVTFPTEAMGSRIVAMPPSGVGMVRAFLTAEPLSLPAGDDFTSGDHALADAIVEAVKNVAGRPPEAPDAVRLDSWGTASITYDIRR